MSKEEIYDNILSLVEAGSLDKAFSTFLSCARGTKVYNNFLLPLNIDYVTFKDDRLAGKNVHGKQADIVTRFVETLDRYKTSDEVVTERPLNVIFCRLYSLNFTHQTKCFEYTCLRKGVIPFIIRESNKFTSEWVLNKLIFRYNEIGTPISNPIVRIDASNITYQTIFERLSESNIINKTKFIKKITKLLENSSLIYVIDNAYNFVHSDYFSDFLDFLKEAHEYTCDESNKCIFIFLENDINTEYTRTDVDITISKNTTIDNFYNIIKNKQNDIHFIDLTYDTSITKHCLDSWRVGNFHNHVVSDENIDDILKECCDGHPERVIPRIAELIGIENFFEICKQNNIRYNG